MNQLWAWEYKEKTEFGWRYWERTLVSLYTAEDSSMSPIKDISQVTKLRKVKIVDEDAVQEITPPTTKTYLTTEQFIKVWKSLDNDKYQELKAVWHAVWGAARDADLAIVVRDKITPDQFNILVQPWTSCGLSLFAEDWEEVLNPTIISEGVEG
jgi:hypothetical protein